MDALAGDFLQTGLARLATCHRTAILAVAVLSFAVNVQADPLVTAVACDSGGQYTCLTSIRSFQVGRQVYDIDFVTANILDAFDVDTTGDITEQFKPLRAAIFWDDVAGAGAFADSLSLLMQSENISGFLCYAGQCNSGLPYGFTFIPVYLQLSPATPLEVASCIVGQGGRFCGYNPGSNNQNWANIRGVPEPTTLLLLGLGAAGLAALSRSPQRRLERKARE
jgi:hypothetical protein